MIFLRKQGHLFALRKRPQGKKKERWGQTSSRMALPREKKGATPFSAGKKKDGHYWMVKERGGGGKRGMRVRIAFP